jgi:hypothetical protein
LPDHSGATAFTDATAFSVSVLINVLLFSVSGHHDWHFLPGL